MHRTQIYLQNALYEQLKRQARSIDVTLSELIRRTLQRNMESDPVAEARRFFDKLQPLESFANADAQEIVRSLRGRSRLLRGAGR